MKRTIKDSVFTDLFTNKKYTLQLYNVLHPEDKRAKEDDIKIVSLSNVIVDKQYNDLGFLVNDKLIVMVEAQSTWSENIVIRILMYLSETYSNYFNERDVNLYSSSKIKVPKPEMYVIYTGKGHKDVNELSFKDVYFPKEDVDLNLKVRVMHDGKKDDILNQYVTFSKLTVDYAEKFKGESSAFVINEVIDFCLSKNVLSEYLSERRVEVMSIMETLFDQETVFKNFLLESNRKSKSEGIKEGKREAVENIALNMCKEGMDIDNISKLTGLSVKEINKLLLTK